MTKTATELVMARYIVPGDVLSFDEGEFTVKRARYGDPYQDGFMALNGRVAAPWIIDLESGERLKAHPNHWIPRMIYGTDHLV